MKRRPCRRSWTRPRKQSPEGRPACHHEKKPLGEPWRVGRGVGAVLLHGSVHGAPECGSRATGRREKSPAGTAGFTKKKQAMNEDEQIRLLHEDLANKYAA